VQRRPRRDAAGGLFVLEPLFLHWWFDERVRHDPESTLAPVASVSGAARHEGSGVSAECSTVGSPWETLMTKLLERDAIYLKRHFDAEIIVLCVRW
jgi:hypothetical protein